VDNGLTGVIGAAANTQWAVMGFRLDTSVVNAAGINLILDGLDIAVAANFTSTSYAGYRILIDPTIGGVVSWQNIPNYSGVQYFIGAATNTISSSEVQIGGGVFNSATKGENLQANSMTKIGAGISGNSNTIVITEWDSIGSARVLLNTQLKLQE
jgi:hypothetical protein